MNQFKEPPHLAAIKSKMAGPTTQITDDVTTLYNLLALFMGLVEWLNLAVIQTKQFALVRSAISPKITRVSGSSCGSGGRLVTSDTRDPESESIH